MRRFRIRVLAGDRVTLAVSPYDLTRGRITYRYKRTGRWRGRASSKTAARPAAPNVRNASRSGAIGSVARRNPAAAGTGRTCRCAPPSQASWRLPLLRTLQFEATLARPLQDPLLRFATLAPCIAFAVALPRHAASQGPRVEITVAAGEGDAGREGSET